MVYRNRLIAGLKETRKRRRRRQLAVGLSELLARVLEELIDESEFRGPDDFLFHRPDGRPVEPKVFREDILYPAMDRAGIPVGAGAVRTRGYRDDRRRLYSRGFGDRPSKRSGFRIGFLGSLWGFWAHFGPKKN